MNAINFAEVEETLREFRSILSYLDPDYCVLWFKNNNQKQSEDYVKTNLDKGRMAIPMPPALFDVLGLEGDEYFVNAREFASLTEKIMTVCRS